MSFKVSRNTYTHHHIKTILIFTICPALVLFMTCQCDLFFIFIIIFTLINLVISWNQTLIFLSFFPFFMSYYFWVIMWMKNVNNSKSSISGCCLEFTWFFANFSLALLIKGLLMKKRIYYENIKMIWDCTFWKSN